MQTEHILKKTKPVFELKTLLEQKWNQVVFVGSMFVLIPFQRLHQGSGVDIWTVSFLSRCLRVLHTVYSYNQQM